MEREDGESECKADGSETHVDGEIKGVFCKERKGGER